MIPALRVEQAFNGHAVGEIITDPDLLARYPQTDAAYVTVGFLYSATGQFVPASSLSH